MITVCFDVDGCLLQANDSRIAREKIRSLVPLFHSMEDVAIVVWSGSGADYAERMARLIHIDHYVDMYAAKSEAPTIQPDLTFDDQVVNLGTVNIRV